jgi:hypothetical protein
LRRRVEVFLRAEPARRAGRQVDDLRVEDLRVDDLRVVVLLRVAVVLRTRRRAPPVADTAPPVVMICGAAKAARIEKTAPCAQPRGVPLR